MNTMHLDARAISAHGGLGDGLAAVLREIAMGKMRMDDNANARANQITERTMARDERQTERERNQANIDRAYNVGLLEKSDGSIVNDPSLAPMAELLKREHARRLSRQGLQDEELRAKAAESGAIDIQAPDRLYPLAQQGARHRQQVLEQGDARISAENMRGLSALLKGMSPSGGRTDAPTQGKIHAADNLALGEGLANGAVSYDDNGKLQIHDPVAWNEMRRRSYASQQVTLPDFNGVEVVHPDEVDAAHKAIEVYQNGDGSWFGNNHKGDGTMLQALNQAALRRAAKAKGFTIPGTPSANLTPAPTAYTPNLDQGQMDDEQPGATPVTMSNALRAASGPSADFKKGAGGWAGYGIPGIPMGQSAPAPAQMPMTSPTPTVPAVPAVNQQDVQFHLKNLHGLDSVKRLNYLKQLQREAPELLPALKATLTGQR